MNFLYFISDKSMDSSKNIIFRIAKYENLQFMSKCYRCNNEITAENASKEHILINACGGRLKSYDLLCKNCNSIFGGKYDSVLAKQINNLAHLLHIKRERDEPQPITATVGSTNEKVVIPFEGDIRKIKPTVTTVKDGDNIQISIEARDMKEFRRIAISLAKKHPQLPVADLLAAAVDKSSYLNNYVSLDEQMGGDDAFRAITKSAVNFFILKGGDSKYISHLLPFLEGEKMEHVVSLHYLPLSVYSFDPDEVSHIVRLKGNPDERILFCYIELFNTQNYIIKLSEEYYGCPLDETYIFNVLTMETLNKRINVNYTKDQLVDILNDESPLPFKIAAERYKRVITIANKNNEIRHVQNISRSSLSKAFGDLPTGTIIGKQHWDKLIGVTSERLVSYLNHKRAASNSLKQKGDQT